MSSIVCLQDDLSDDNSVTMREMNLQARSVQIDEVQLEDEVGTVLDLQDLHVVAEGVKPEPGVELVQPVLSALTVQSVDVWLVVTQQRQGHGLLQGHHHQAGGPHHHHQQQLQ